MIVSERSKPAILLPGSGVAGRPSLCGPLREVIAPAVQAGLSAQRIYQDLIGTHAFAGSYHSVQRFVRQWLQRDVGLAGPPQAGVRQFAPERPSGLPRLKT